MDGLDLGFWLEAFWSCRGLGHCFSGLWMPGRNSIRVDNRSKPDDAGTNAIQAGILVLPLITYKNADGLTLS